MVATRAAIFCLALGLATLALALSMERREHTFKVYDANGNTVTCMEIDRGQR